MGMSPLQAQLKETYGKESKADWNDKDHQLDQLRRTYYNLA